jgi:hypothetical protein
MFIVPFPPMQSTNVPGKKTTPVRVQSLALSSLSTSPSFSFHPSQLNMGGHGTSQSSHLYLHHSLQFTKHSPSTYCPWTLCSCLPEGMQAVSALDLPFLSVWLWSHQWEADTSSGIKSQMLSAVHLSAAERCLGWGEVTLKRCYWSIKWLGSGPAPEQWSGMGLGSDAHTPRPMASAREDMVSIISVQFYCAIGWQIVTEPSFLLPKSGCQGSQRACTEGGHSYPETSLNHWASCSWGSQGPSLYCDLG